MALFSFYILIIYFIKSSIQIEVNNSYIISNLNDKKLMLPETKIILDFIIVIIEKIKEDKNLDNLLELIRGFWNDEIISILNDHSLKFLIPLFDDLLFNESNTFINDTYDIINKNENSSDLLDSLINLLEYLKSTESRKINLTYKFFNF